MVRRSPRLRGETIVCSSTRDGESEGVGRTTGKEGCVSKLPTPNRHMCCLLVVVAAACLVQGVLGLQIRDIQVPDMIEAGQVVRLSCLFDAEAEDLYSVKWYKDEVEFFRFLPRDKPNNQIFEIGDVEVDMSRSSNGTVFLKNTSRSAEGTYKCEVSADAPSFASIFSEKFMAVEDRPIATSQNAAAHALTSPAIGQLLWTVATLIL